MLHFSTNLNWLKCSTEDIFEFFFSCTNCRKLKIQFGFFRKSIVNFKTSSVVLKKFHVIQRTCSTTNLVSYQSIQYKNYAIEMQRRGIISTLIACAEWHFPVFSSRVYSAALENAQTSISFWGSIQCYTVSEYTLKWSLQSDTKHFMRKGKCRFFFSFWTKKILWNSWISQSVTRSRMVFIGLILNVYSFI